MFLIWFTPFYSIQYNYTHRYHLPYSCDHIQDVRVRSRVELEWMKLVFHWNLGQCMLSSLLILGDSVLLSIPTWIIELSIYSRICFSSIAKGPKNTRCFNSYLSLISVPLHCPNGVFTLTKYGYVNGAPRAPLTILGWILNPWEKAICNKTDTTINFVIVNDILLLWHWLLYTKISQSKSLCYQHCRQ